MTGNLYQESLFSTLLPLIEEHVLCSVKIKQLKLKRKLTSVEEEDSRTETLTILANLQRQDEKRLIEALRSVGE